MASRSVLVTKGKHVWGASRLHHYCVHGEVVFAQETVHGCKFCQFIKRCDVFFHYCRPQYKGIILMLAWFDIVWIPEEPPGILMLLILLVVQKTADRLALFAVYHTRLTSQ